MGRIPTGVTIWSLKRFTKSANLWDRTCLICKQVTPVFEYEYRDEQDHALFNYLCEACAQQKLTEWFHKNTRPDDLPPEAPVEFDSASVFYEQKNDGETLLLTRWSTEQRRRRLQGESK